VELLLMAAQSPALPILAESSGREPGFDQALEQHGCSPLAREETITLQINVGKLCNQACHHCHVDAGPKRTEIMPRHIAQRAMELLAASPEIATVDITGGAPELNPNFHFLVGESRRLGRHVIDRCNLTVLLEPGSETLAEFLAAHEVEISASLPCYTAETVEKQRGQGVFEKSIAALRRLNELGYGMPDSKLRLNLVYNPVGAYLPPPQEKLEEDYRQRLRDPFGVEFHRLLTITNMPIHRFAAFLRQSGRYEAYMTLLAEHFNPLTVPQLMCRSLVSLGWNGKLYDCDFNQMLEIKIGGDPDRPCTIWDVNSFSGLPGRCIATGNHCFGCTAGAGSSCGGALQ
jgi:radical SAM/Cys-rich protein